MESMQSFERTFYRKRRLQTGFILFVLLIAVGCLLSEIRISWAIERTLPAVLWDAWDLKHDVTNIHIQGMLTVQLGRPLEFVGDFEIEGADFAKKESGNSALVRLTRDRRTGLLHGFLEYYTPSLDTEPIGNFYTNTDFSELLIVIPNQSRWMVYASPAETLTEAKILLQRYAS